ncbi:zinc finger protein CONSTANS-LIKE 6-like [Triticum dicoccoides]|uniref:zinc finger protein CONSTANS-LIKE 6-like n=1 Tax=Triticum dicoccoides TaxID=85692 RepID=UPI00188F5798|nr:zinc finger protein CONSTANS-LIKE 6-like [Triticum dicoccoides]
MASAGAAIGARAARACDGCMRRRARWHCAADDAYLCQACDASVHSANPLARRHHRVRLPSSSSPAATSSLQHADPDEPAWLHGLKRRPRTPRSKPGMVGKHGAPAAAKAAAASAVPDLEAEDSGSGIVGDNDEGHGVEVDDEDLLYRVPVFDPMLAELYNPVPVDEFREPLEQKPSVCCFSSLANQPSSEYASGVAEAADGFSGFDVVPDMELASFAADMESLLMGGVEEGFDDLRFLDEEKPQLNLDFDMADFDDQSTAAPAPEQELGDRKRKRSDSGMILKLDYERVIDSWAHDGGSPWFYGERPHIDPSDDSWLDLPAGSRGFGLGAAVTAVTGGEREARVSRYREKRRTRLFAKKIRYEVRKLNAEKRPRMKGRFVKRTALPPLPPRPPMVLAGHGHGGAHGRFRF